MRLIKKFQNISHQYALWKKGDKIVIACSGGPDSTCLLDIFCKLKNKYNLELIVAHVNYGLRGKDSDKDEEFVKNLAKKYFLDIKVLRVRNLISGEGKMPAENKLRKIRYDFFEKVRRQNGFHHIAVGHTLDDQAETFLMRLLRGAGLRGLSAMKHKNGQVIRPLLGITRKEVIDYLRNTGLSFREDKTNKEVYFLRNRIRNELLPLLEKKYNPNIKSVLYKSSLIIAEDYALLDSLVSRKMGMIEDGKISIEKLKKLPPALQRLMLIKAIEKIKPNAENLELAHIDEIIKILRSRKSKERKVFFQGLKITARGDRMFLSLNPQK